MKSRSKESLLFNVGITLLNHVEAREKLDSRHENPYKILNS
jgi:hypothetical protein